MRRRRLPSEAPAPALNPAALLELAGESSAAAAESFADNYAALLPRRVERITSSVGVWDRTTAFHAVLSLETASAMVGALRMVELCRRLERSLLDADLAGAATGGRDIQCHLPVLQTALAGRSGQPPGTGFRHS